MVKVKPLKEEDIQIAFVKWVEANKENFDVDFLTYFSVPNERKSNSHHMQKLKRMGLKAGVSDLVFIYSKDDTLRVLFLELKRKGGKQSDNQKTFEEEVKDYCDYMVAHSFKEAKETIEGFFND